MADLRGQALRAIRKEIRYLPPIGSEEEKKGTKEKKQFLRWLLKKTKNTSFGYEEYT